MARQGNSFGHHKYGVNDDAHVEENEDLETHEQHGSTTMMTMTTRFIIMTTKAMIFKFMKQPCARIDTPSKVASSKKRSSETVVSSNGRRFPRNAMARTTRSKKRSKLPHSTSNETLEVAVTTAQTSGVRGTATIKAHEGTLEGTSWGIEAAEEEAEADDDIMPVYYASSGRRRTTC